MGKITNVLGDFGTVIQERIQADISRMVPALRSIGYSFEQAVADLVDNSIDADAKNVLIRFQINKDKSFSIIIADDGNGMSDAGLFEAMRLGSKLIKGKTKLGKYGLGLKLASLSQCKSFTVASKNKKNISARRWTEKGLKSGCRCDRFTKSQATRIYNMPLDCLNLSKHGTVIIWNEIDRIKIQPQDIERKILKLKNRIDKHLGLYFHRFLS